MTRLFGFMAGMLLALSASAAQDVTVSGAWVRATAPGQPSAAASMNITSAHDAKLVGVTVSKGVADNAELHTMKHENGMMVMRRVDSLALPAGHVVSLGKGDHIMLNGLKHPLKAGESVPLELTIETADKRHETVKVNAAVRMYAPHGMGDMHDMGSMHDSN